MMCNQVQLNSTNSEHYVLLKVTLFTIYCGTKKGNWTKEVVEGNQHLSHIPFQVCSITVEL